MKRKSKAVKTTNQNSTEFTDEQAVEVIKQLHGHNAKAEMIRLYKKSFGQLAEDFIVEKNAKNKAYYFILSQGHHDAFVEYCKVAKNLFHTE